MKADNFFPNFFCLDTRLVKFDCRHYDKRKVSTLFESESKVDSIKYLFRDFTMVTGQQPLVLNLAYVPNLYAWI
jgi:hypothetical protein